MNKQSVNIFLSSTLDSEGSASSFTNPIPSTKLNELSEIALAEIILPEECADEVTQSFNLQKIFQKDAIDYLKLRLKQFRTTKDLADHLNNQITETVSMRGDSVAHVIFSVSQNGCLVGTANSYKTDEYLGFMDEERAETFGSLLGFNEHQSRQLFASFPRDIHEAERLPSLVQTPFLKVYINLLSGEPLRVIESGAKRIVFKDKVYKSVARGIFTSIKVDIVNPQTNQVVKFKRGNTVAVLNLREGNG